MNKQTNIYMIMLLVFAFVIPACAGIKRRDFDRLVLLQQRYSGSIVRVNFMKENGGLSGGTAFYAGQDTGFITARHVLMHEDEHKNEHLAGQLMLHIPMAKTGFIAKMGTPPPDKHSVSQLYESDWAVFQPTHDVLVRRSLMYDPDRPLRPNQEVYVMGYPNLGREYEYSGSIPLEYLATRNLFIYRTKYIRLILRIASLDKTIKLDAVDTQNIDVQWDGISGGPVLIWDNEINDFVAVGVITTSWNKVHPSTPLLGFIRPKIPPIVPSPETN